MFEKLPVQLKSRGIITQTTELAWRYKDAIDIINYLESKGCFILGGDVLKNNFEYTCDNWFFEIEKRMSNNEALRESARRAREYIDWYHQEFGDEFYYVIVVSQ